MNVIDFSLGFQGLLGKRFSFTLDPAYIGGDFYGQAALTWAFGLERKSRQGNIKLQVISSFLSEEEDSMMNPFLMVGFTS